MLYLYTIMMRAWDLDEDTHAYFRGYLEGFINKRKISKDLREYVVDIDQRRDPIPAQNEEDKINELRIGLSYRVIDSMTTYKDRSLDSPPQLWNVGRPCRMPEEVWKWNPSPIEKIHPPRYDHNAKELSTRSQPHTNP